MDESTFQRLRLLFDALVALPPSRRRAEIEACDDLDDDTRRRLHALLHWDVDAAHLTAATALTPLRSDPLRRVGERIGAYVVEELLGEGGMGSVWRARRVAGEIEQQVAIKIARRQVLDDAALARFRLERQVLALLQHPQIATLHDLGELDDGTPYFVMEYVQGRPLLDDVAARGLGLEERLRLFLLLCDAVAHAHRNLVVHRDIKPGNVLVTADGLPKLLDFGIAKPLRPRLGAVDVEQTREAHRYFSLRNAAPEQLRGGAVGVTCDVYGLGSLLYELLCGRPLYDFAGSSLSQIERRIAEDDPLPPSRRVRDDAAAPAWQRALPRDLDAIVLKALRRDPQARYPDVDAFAADLHRYLGGYAVGAREPSLLYRAGRFVRRHRIALATGLLFAIVVGIGVASWLRQYYSTLAERDRAESVTRTIVRALEIAAPAGVAEKQISAQNLFQQVGNLALTPAFDEQPATRVQLAATVARIQYQLGQPAAALALLDRVAGEARQVPDAPREEFDATRADALLALGEIDRAAALAAGRAEAASSDQARTHWRLLEVELELDRERYAAALQRLQEILAPDSGASREQRWRARHQQSYALLRSDRSAEALAVEKALLAEQRAWYRGAHPDVLASVQFALQIASESRATDVLEPLIREAVDLCRELYGVDSHPCIATAHRRAEILAELGRYDEALDVARDALARALDYARGESELAAKVHFTLAAIQQQRGDSAAALSHLRDAVRIGDAQMSDYGFTLMRMRTSLIVALLEQGDAVGASAAAAAAEAVLARRPQLARN
ncbi:protein kinase domain-containing protein, partial [Tahibacter caeni]|uniref:protein kinase domain-containing protein n=1 Tax=Tahibacter caeni TaxID=1453545 RepID=UPI0021480EEE